MAGSKSIGSIFASLSIRDVNFQKGLKKASTSLAGLGTSALKYGSVAAGAVVAGLAAGTKNAFAMGGELVDLSAQTGVAISDLMRIQQAYKDNGKEASSAGKDINKMQKAIVEASKNAGGDSDPFAAIGLSVEKLMEMNPTDQFFAIGGAIKKIGNPAEQAAAAMKIFGKSGGELLSVFKGTSLDDVNKSLGKMPELMGQFAEKFDRVDDVLERLPNKANQFFVGFASGVVDEIMPAMDEINGYDFTELGQSFGETIGDAIKSITDIISSGHAWELFLLQAELAFATLLESPALMKISELLNFVGDNLTTASGIIGKIPGASLPSTLVANAASNASGVGSLAEYAGGGQMSEDLMNRIDALQESIAQASQDAKDNAKKSDQQNKEKPIAEEIANAITQVATPETQMGQPDFQPDLQIQQMQGANIDEYQRRGLSMSKTPGSTQDKLLKIQEQIRDILQAAKIQGKELVWQ